MPPVELSGAEASSAESSRDVEAPRPDDIEALTRKKDRNSACAPLESGTAGDSGCARVVDSGRAPSPIATSSVVEFFRVEMARVETTAVELSGDIKLPRPSMDRISACGVVVADAMRRPACARPSALWVRLGATCVRRSVPCVIPARLPPPASSRVEIARAESSGLELACVESPCGRRSGVEWLGAPLFSSVESSSRGCSFISVPSSTLMRLTNPLSGRP